LYTAASGEQLAAAMARKTRYMESMEPSWHLSSAVKADAVGARPETRREEKAARAARGRPEAARDEMRVV
jgi:hypothetical protein